MTFHIVRRVVNEQWQSILPPCPSLLILSLRPCWEDKSIDDAQGILDFFVQNSSHPDTVFRRMSIDFTPATTIPVGIRYNTSAFEAVNALKKYPR